MAFCTKCGSHIENDVKFCPQCGAPVEGPAPSSTAEELERALETQDTTGGYSAQDIADNKLLCILCYFGLLLLIPLLVKKDSPFVRFHCNQGPSFRSFPLSVGWWASWLRWPVSSSGCWAL